MSVATALLTAVAITLPVVTASSTTATGFEAEQLRGKRETLQARINQIEGEIGALTSLGRVAERAAALGFGPGPEPLYVSIDVPGPAAPKLPAEYFTASP